jgi:hypothetical protein
MAYSISDSVTDNMRSSRSMYNDHYYEIFKDFAEKHTKPQPPERMHNFNFSKNVLLDKEANVGNRKAKYHIQGANPIRMCRKLEKELTGANYEFLAKNDYNVSRYYIDELSAPNIHETLKCEEMLWKLITE